MRVLKTLLIACCIFTMLGNAKCQQQQMYTQYMYNKMAINPGYAGHDKYLGFTALIRDQWNGVPGAPEAQHLSVNLPTIGKSVGVGFNLNRQSIGISKAITVSGIYAYKFNLGTGLLSMGLEISGRSLVMDFTDDRLIATQGLEFDPSIPNEKMSLNSLNAGYGIYFNTNNFYLGMSAPRLIKSDLDFDNNNFVSQEVRHLYIMGGASFVLTDALSLTTQSLLKFAEQSPWDADLSATLTLEEKYNFGLNYRFGGAFGDVGESMALILTFQLSDQLMMGISQDFTLSKLRRFDNGSIELFAHYAFGKKKEKVVVINPRYF